jgi:hypothetical protein
MAFAPQLHPAHGLRSPEVIAVAVFTQPPVLAGCLACLLATRLGTIPLSVGGPRIRNKKLAATAAFTPGLRAAHGEPNLRRIRRRRKQKRRSPRKSRPKKEEQILDRSDRRKRLGRKWIFKPPAFPSFIPPLTQPGWIAGHLGFCSQVQPPTGVQRKGVRRLDQSIDGVWLVALSEEGDRDPERAVA